MRGVVPQKERVIMEPWIQIYCIIGALVAYGAFRFLFEKGDGAIGVIIGGIMSLFIGLLWPFPAAFIIWLLYKLLKSIVQLNARKEASPS